MTITCFTYQQSSYIVNEVNLTAKHTKECIVNTKIMRKVGVHLLGLLLAGCAILPVNNHNSIASITLSMASNIRVNYVVNMSVVFAYDDTAKNYLNAISARQWFAESSAILASGLPIDLITLQLAPNTEDMDIKLPENSRNAIYVAAFAYLPAAASGNDKVNMTTFKNVKLTIEQQQLVIREAQP